MPVPDRLHVIGVRHHSPACARRVRSRITALHPAFVLIEGPADFNPYINDLQRPHELPVAIFSFSSGAGHVQASYSPFCVYSPEWQALQAAWETGATPLFCDLPAWHPAFGERENRYADPHDLDTRYQQAQSWLMSRLGAEGADALWDTVAEQVDDETLLGDVLDRYFEGIRPDGLEDPRESEREAFMGRHAAWALAQAAGRDVVVVCGGWHASAIRQHAASADGRLPDIPLPLEGAQAGSYLVPYSYARLDRFTGYASGMPSPAYYEKLFEAGPLVAVEWGMRHMAQVLRDAGQLLSTADFIAWRTQAELLARLRGHRCILRADLLDGALSTVIKEALDVPPAWTEPGRVQRGSDPMLVALLQALSGSRQGRLAAGTRHPPLIADVEARLNACGFDPQMPMRRIEVDWHSEQDRVSARLLHQMVILGLPGVSLVHGPQTTDARDLGEVFEMRRHPEWLGALIEASIWGGTLETAAVARLEARVAEKGDLHALADGVAQATFAGLLGVGEHLLQTLTGSVLQAHELSGLGRCALRVIQLYRFGDVFGTTLHAGLRPLCRALFERILWLVENAGAGQSNDDIVLAVLACRDLLRYGDGLDLDAAFASATLGRCVGNPQSPPALAGAALGFRIALAEDALDNQTVAVQIRRHSLPECLGDFLGGLLALAREQVGQADGVLTAIDEWVCGWSAEEFLIALPAMRGAFAWLPPRERERIAQVLLRQAGFDEVHIQTEALAWMRLHVQPRDQARALVREQHAVERLRRHGLVLDDAEVRHLPGRDTK